MQAWKLRKQMTVEEKNAILSMHRQGYSSRKIAEMQQMQLQFPDLWKDLMKLDVQKINPDVRFAWE